MKPSMYLHNNLSADQLSAVCLMESDAGRHEIMTLVDFMAASI